MLLRQLGLPHWRYGLAFAAPCRGGLIGPRLARRVVARFGRHRAFRTVGTLRAIRLIGQQASIALPTALAGLLADVTSQPAHAPL